MPGITLMTACGIKVGTVGVVKWVSGEIRPKLQRPMNLRNVITYLGVIAGEIIKAHYLHG